ncbi:MAG: XRE family transcriptional regulator [Chloroflexota bacterium]
MTSPETWRTVGNKIRYLRKSTGLTLRQLARGCGLSANTISLVERSEVAPNIETLCKIANALGVSPSSLFLEVCKPAVVLQRANESGLAGDPAERAVQLLVAVPGAASCAPNIPRPGADAPPPGRHSILCLCGQVELELNGQTYALNPGDSLAFTCDTFHRWRSSGDATGIAVMILPPPPLREEPDRQQI